MSYQVLARKWRPQTFHDVVGQRHVLTALANGLDHQRLHHAYLFSGTRGVGKTTIARLFAKGLNCETGITSKPCGQCANCLEIEQGRFVDLIEIDAASRTKVEDTRELLDNVQYAPARGRFKVYLIDEVHMLSRHSFNALLKTLEEPPEHVKFLLATTDPQKLPVTILSRCLQFHLRALDIDQIATQLEKVLTAEHIENDVRARQLIARAADGSMRDALSLTDQAIASGEGVVSTEVVSQMLGTIDDAQPLALIEALVKADGQQVMSLVNEVASRGTDWENFLVETLSLLHQIAMLQLLPSEDNPQEQFTQERLRLLAKSVSPQDLQLYYQTLLVGRKELAYAPDRRMGVEMTLLRALAFHPKTVIDEVSSAPLAQTLPSTSLPTNRMSEHNAQQVPQIHSSQNTRSSSPMDNASLGNSPAAQLLRARQAIKGTEQQTPPKKSEPAMPNQAKPAASALERLAAVSERRQQVAKRQSNPNALEKKKKEAYQWRPQNPELMSTQETVSSPKEIKEVLEYEKTPELAAKIAKESQERDAWAAEIEKMPLPKLVQQLALNAYKETVSEENVILHLRTRQKHLNSANALRTLTNALSELHGKAISLTIIEDDDPAVKTPLEWRQAIYDEKLALSRQSIITDKTIQTLQQYFDAELDEESIRPV
ncbi:DNA polymerase III subunit gamma/tau [Proteus vulgaris]|uniref:DNA polymerase III subunit gamma/tau n=1 Tax=Proteus vulgaris TaxID=585 RepID=A0A379F6G7_PROVU|nr:MULTISPECIES: DNA polymerase III subunit gamma/tau [Proteus]MBG5984586.1 DNA polymerase III subunit gamma/tau [Proteus vulgaris]MDM3563597.1 DNA polymerase III subunit gamma/tau [Proteus vulgaris]NBN73762.1 DNA polymerase III subunit gamma/tau [Proteus sp. G2615]NBN84674.1 DNA polymerase III subunit gamma/tau [Proteus sp. G2300]SUC15228.1 DNA polymerase III Tau subunit (contains DNA polymerase III Gamma subunit) [Proteus vulgaris]